MSALKFGSQKPGVCEALRERECVCVCVSDGYREAQAMLGKRASRLGLCDRVYRQDNGEARQKKKAGCAMASLTVQQ